jgi:hypothetical protein
MHIFHYNRLDFTILTNEMRDFQGEHTMVVMSVKMAVHCAVWLKFTDVSEELTASIMTTLALHAVAHLKRQSICTRLHDATNQKKATFTILTLLDNL